MLAVIVLALYGTAVIFDFLPNRKERKKSENILYCVLLTISLCILVLYTFNIIVPSPSKAIKFIVEKVLSFFR